MNKIATNPDVLQTHPATNCAMKLRTKLLARFGPARHDPQGFGVSGGPRGWVTSFQTIVRAPEKPNFAIDAG